MLTFVPSLQKYMQNMLNKSYSSYYYFWFYFAGHCEAGSCV